MLQLFLLFFFLHFWRYFNWFWPWSIGCTYTLYHCWWSWSIHNIGSIENSRFFRFRLDRIRHSLLWSFGRWTCNSGAICDLFFFHCWLNILLVTYISFILGCCYTCITEWNKLWWCYINAKGGMTNLVIIFFCKESWLKIKSMVLCFFLNLSLYLSKWIILIPLTLWGSLSDTKLILLHLIVLIHVLSQNNL